MQQSSAAAPGEHGCMAAAEGMLSLRKRKLVAQLHELLFPSPSPAPTPAPSSGGASTPGLNVAGCPSDECSPVKAAPVSCGGRTRQRRGSKRVRKDEQIDQEEQHGGGGANAKIRCRRKKHGTTTLVTTVPDFDGYQWRKYGQKKIEAAKYPRSYYRCINSTDQGCSAKRTVQRNDDENKGGGGPPKYTVVYISEHTCKAIESAAPVILETTVRTKNQAADGNAAAAAATHVMLSPPDVAVVVPAESSTTSTRTESPAISDITWSGDTDPSEHGDYSHLFASDEWDPTTVAPAATALLHEMDFAGPIRSPVHIASDGWIDGLFFNEPSVLDSCHLFGF